MRDFVTRKELAELTGKSLRTIDNWVDTMDAPFYKFGSDVVFKIEEIDKWAKDRANAEIKRRKEIKKLAKNETSKG